MTRGSADAAQEWYNASHMNVGTVPVGQSSAAMVAMAEETKRILALFEVDDQAFSAVE
jgi:hypothetical protein